MNHHERQRVVITGSNGSIGRILQEGLANDFDLLCIDRVANDNKIIGLDLISQPRQLKERLSSRDVVVHLAWDMDEDFPSENIIPGNKLMAENIYQAAVEVGVSRVIMASSVHADNYANERDGAEISPTRDPFPDSPYGASKLYIENLGKYYANKYGVEIVCVRFGGVNADDKILYDEDPLYDKVLLYRNDCVNLIKKLIWVDIVPGNFSVLYAVSDNPGRRHSLENFIGWKPTFPR